MQRTHENSNFSQKKFPITLILDNVKGPANIGGLFRLADAFNIEKLILCGSKPNLKSNRLLKSARSTVQKVNYEVQEDVSVICSKLSARNYCIIALEITNNSISLHEFNFKKVKKLALILGNENVGVGKEALKLADQSIHINMFGGNSSMNVTQAAGIALYEITKTLSSIKQK